MWKCVAVGLSVFFLSSILLVTPALAKKDKLNISVVVDNESLTAKPQGVMGAWIGYAMARANWISDHVKAGSAEAKTYVRTFEEEVAGRDSLVTIWGELKASESGLADLYLDQLQRVKEAGFLREYVWVNLRQAEWSVEPTGLQLARFEAWAKENIDGHVVETHADAKIEKDKGK